MEGYKLWVRKNKDFVHSLESLANGITWLLPERFSNSEIGPEAVYAFLGIVSALNQHIIDTAPNRFRPPVSRESSFPWPLCLSMIKDVETVVEVAAQHFFGEDGKWNFIAATEATKALVRVALLRDSGYKMLLQGGETVNEDKRIQVPGVPNGGLENHQNLVGHRAHGYNPDFHGYVPKNLEGRAMSALSRFGEDARMISNPTWRTWLLHSENEAPATSLEKPTSLTTIWYEKGLSGRLFLTGEVLFIIRPLIYVTLIRNHGIRSWLPWLVSLAVDITGMSILSWATSPRSEKEKFFELSRLEKDELKRRKLILALYLMRDPFFTKHTKHRLGKVDSYLSHVPFVGFFTSKLVELLIGAQTRYTYISGS